MNINEVTLAGNICNELELRYTPSGMSVLEFSVAVNEYSKDKEARATFVNVTAFGKTAETIDRYLGKGKPIYIKGRLKMSSWEKDNKKYSKLFVVAESMQFIGSGDKKEPVRNQRVPAEANEPAPDFGCDEEIPF